MPIVPRYCDTCGADLYFAKHFDQIRDTNTRMKKDMEHEAARWAVERARLKLQLMEEQNRHQWLARKVRAQSYVIHRLEEKLKKRGEKPYAEKEVLADSWGGD